MPAAGPLERPDLFVLARILDRLAIAQDPPLKTHLQTACNVSYDNLLRYLEWMTKRDLVELRTRPDGQEGLALTRRGSDAMRRIADWIADFTTQGAPPRAARPGSEPPQTKK